MKIGTMDSFKKNKKNNPEDIFFFVWVKFQRHTLFTFSFCFFPTPTKPHFIGKS